MRRLFLKLFRRRRLQQDLETEIEFHREMSRLHRNEIPLGNTGHIKEQALDLWRFTLIENLWRDLVYAARVLRSSPGLVIAALLSLGLGIGANAAMFSLGIEFLFSEPSVRDPASLVSIRLGGNSNSPEDAVNFLRASGLFEDVAGENEEAFSNFNDGVETRRVFAVYTTQNYFTALGVPTLYGRGILPGDPKEVVVLRYQFWRKYFHGDPSIIGHSINLDGRACTVVGILREHHRSLIGFGYSPDVYMPNWLDTSTLAIYARLKPGMQLAQARAGLKIVAQRMNAAFPANAWKFDQNLSVSAIAGYARFSSESEMMTIGVFFALLLAITGLVLVIACVNVAGLLLARASARRSEIAIRLALGASRRRLLQQLLAESVLLALMGAIFGFAFSQMTAALLAQIQLPLPLPIFLQIAPDWRVAAYCAFLTSLTILLCGLLPAVQSVRESIAPDLKRESKLRLRRVLVIVQIAISVVVLATGFLFLRNLVSANALSPGFDVRHTLRADVDLPPATYANPLRKEGYIHQVLNELSALPGIESVAAARLTPFTDNVAFGSTLTFLDNGKETHAYFKWNAVTPEFFKAMGIPLYRGYTFPTKIGAEKIVIVNRVFVECYLGNRQPVGAVFLWGTDNKTPYRIVGLVEGTKTITIGEEPQPQFYEPLAQIDNDRPRIQFVMRSAIAPALQLGSVRHILHRIDPMAGADVETMISSIGLAFLPSQVGAVLLGSIGVLGLVLAMVGLYGVMGYSVARRTREIGLRMAIGATRGDISKMVLRECGRLTLAGSCVGLFTAFFITKPLVLFLVPGVKPTDPLSLSVVMMVMLLTAAAASWGPLRRAVTIDPNTALRYE